MSVSPMRLLTGPPHHQGGRFPGLRRLTEFSSAGVRSVRGTHTGMLVKVFGRRGCRQSHAAWLRAGEILRACRAGDSGRVVFYDLDTPGGLAEALFHEVDVRTPVIVVECPEHEIPLCRQETLANLCTPAIPAMSLN